MSDSDEPPLVTRVPPTAPKLARPGLGESIVWCLVFFATQIGAAIAGMGVVLTIFALQENEPTKFITDQFNGLVSATAETAPAGSRPPVPSQIGQSLAYGMLAAQIASLGLILLVLPRIIGPDWRRQIGVRRPAALHVLLVFLLVPGFMILAGGVQVGFAKLTGITPPAALETLNGLFRHVPWYVTFLSVSLGPAFVEEMWCRGLVGRGLCARYGLVVGVVVTSLLFGLLHMDPSQLLVITLMGVYLHFVYLASRSIWIPILLHLLNNGLAIFIALTQQGPAELDVEPKLLAPIYYLVSFSLVLFASIALWTGRAELQPIQSQEEDWWGSPGWKPEYPGISTPPPAAAGEVKIGYARLSPASVILTVVSFVAMIYLLTR